MTSRRGRVLGAMAAVVLLLTATAPRFAEAASAEELDRNGAAALAKLYQGNEVARMLGEKAAGVLVFPRIVKAGFMFGGQIGEGVLRKGQSSAGYYNTVAASWGLQAGVQTFGYALMFIDSASLSKFESSSGFEVGVGPSIVVVDAGVGKNLSSTTVRDGIYAFIFDQAGLMAGLGIQGSKITKIDK